MHLFLVSHLLCSHSATVTVKKGSPALCEGRMRGRGEEEMNKEKHGGMQRGSWPPFKASRWPRHAEREFNA
ncbi:unnamed protein product [Arctogadus glacialis]